MYGIGAVGFLGVIYAAYLLTTFEEKPTDLFEMAVIAITVVTNATTHFQPKRNALRYLYMGSCYIGLLLVNIFGAFYIVALTHPVFEDQLKHISSLIENRFQLMGDVYVLYKIDQQDMVIFAFI